MREHGTLAAYKVEGCKCGPCEAANTRYVARRNRLIAYGQWRPYVDAEPVREHVRTLQAAGLGWRRIAQLAGVPNGSISKLIYGDGRRGMAPSKRVRPHTAAAVLAIQPGLDVLGGTALVDGAGTRRRLQALVAVGWAQARLADHLGIHRTNLNKMLLDQDKPVYARTARAARALYEELWDSPPPQGGHREKISASRARNYARERDWFPPAAWDDDLIDLPAAELDAEVAARAALMGDDEAGSCYTARYKHGDRTPLTMAGAREYDRRRAARKTVA